MTHRRWSGSFEVRETTLEHQHIGMGRKQAPGKKGQVQCSPEPERAALSSSPIHNVSSARSQNDAQRDREVKPLPGNLPCMIILSMLEQLEVKLDNLMSTVEDVPSRVAGLMEKIWIAKGEHHLVHGGASLEMVSTMTVKDCPFSRSPPIPLSVRASELNQCLHPASPAGHEPKHSPCLQRLFSDGHGPQQDCTLSRCPPPDVPVTPVEPSLHLQPAIDEDQETQRNQCTQLEPEDHVKEEHLPGESWGPQQNFCLQSPFYERHEPQQNHCIQRVLTDEKEPHEHIKQELLWIDGKVQQQKHYRQPAFQEEQSPQHNACLQQVFSDASDQHQNCKTEPMRPEAQNADQCNKLETQHPENCDQNYKQEPLHPEDRGENSDLKPTCTDAPGPSVSSLFLAQNTADTDGVIATDPWREEIQNQMYCCSKPSQRSCHRQKVRMVKRIMKLLEKERILLTK
ncbi:uncharacterized protein [Pleurodeles waltl]|uniref:uncharacterized protein isoform X2 n=1 Tax=Pleurodeles waltl TaxID=8319 RepID=UPI0037097848